MKISHIQFSCNVPAKVSGRVPTSAPVKSKFVADKDGVAIKLDKGQVALTYEDGQEIRVPFANVDWFVAE